MRLGHKFSDLPSMHKATIYFAFVPIGCRGSRFPRFVMEQMSTNENPSTDKLSRATIAAVYAQIGQIKDWSSQSLA